MERGQTPLENNLGLLQRGGVVVVCAQCSRALGGGGSGLQQAAVLALGRKEGRGLPTAHNPMSESHTLSIGLAKYQDASRAMWFRLTRRWVEGGTWDGKCGEGV